MAGPFPRDAIFFCQYINKFKQPGTFNRIIRYLLQTAFSNFDTGIFGIVHACLKKNTAGLYAVNGEQARLPFRWS